MQDQLSDIYKIIIIGDANVGKTHILYCFSKQKVPSNIMPTIALEYTSKIMELEPNKNVRAQIWDTSGQEQYRALTMNHYRKSVGALIVYDVTNKKSFQHASQWLSAVIDKADPNVQIGLIGHKIDQFKREVSREEAQEFATKANIFYMQTTVKDPNSIKNAFRKLITKIIKTKRSQVVGIKLNQTQLLKENDSQCQC